VVHDVTPFTVLVGPNGAGKSSFLDCVALVTDYVRETLDAAVLFSPDESQGRSLRLKELVFNQSAQWFEVALDFSIPASLMLDEVRGGTSYRYDTAR
jgi:predicted ATPase